MKKNLFQSGRKNQSELNGLRRFFTIWKNLPDRARKNDRFNKYFPKEEKFNDKVNLVYPA